MNVRTRLFAALAVVLMAVAVAIPTASACACIEPLSDTELAATKARANRGDFEAIHRVLAEYRLRKDQKNTQLWTQRAIQAGAPLALQDLASDWLWKTQAAQNVRSKKKYARAARALLERGFQSRRRIPSQDHLDLRPAALFAENLREARAVTIVLNDGLDPWIAKARRGDAIAAYHVAKYYFWVELDQRKRTFWETRASELGDPSFAGETVNYNRTTEQDLRDINKALHSPSILARSGDKWMQHQFVESLKERQDRLRSRGRPGSSR